MFYHHLINLSKGSLAYEVTQIQDILGFPGLVQESKLLIEKYELPSPESCTKGQWRGLTKKAITKQNKKDILEKMKSFKKLDYSIHAQESFGLQDYVKNFNIPDARLKFALRSKMLRTVQMNFKGEKQYKDNGWKCVSCNNLDTQEHLLSCEGYNFLRVGRNMDQDKDLVAFFRGVIKHRMESGLE